MDIQETRRQVLEISEQRKQRIFGIDIYIYLLASFIITIFMRKTLLKF